MKYLLPLLAIMVFSVVSYAATVQVSPGGPYQGVNGVYYNVTGGFTAAGNGFLVVSSTVGASACTWTSGGSCNTALTAGDWYYSVTITAAAGATLPHVSVSWQTTTAGAYVSLGTITVTTGTPATGNTMTFLFDTGVNQFTAPNGIVITVT